MFNIDHWQEILHTMKKNKLRTVITAFNVAWGIFILIILMGFGIGYQNGVRNQFNDDAINTIFFRGGQTSKAYKGIQSGRDINFDNTDYNMILQYIEGVDKLTGRYNVRGEFTVRYLNKYSSFSIRAVHPDHEYIEKTIITHGRYINAKDIDEKRKVAVIGYRVVEILFGNHWPIGKYITINKIKYKIVGMYDDEEDERENKRIYIPISTAQIAYGGGNRIHNLSLSVGNANGEESIVIQDNVHELLAQNHVFSVDDKRAVQTWNVLEEYERWMKTFDGIRMFLLFVGGFTLLAGVVGISNIMLIVVKERTREVGLRKALGATPRSIIALFLNEALLVTIISGYLGLLVGVAVIDLGWLSALMDSVGFPMNFFIEPNINVGGAVVATIILIFCGLLAGYFPARKAARIQPIDALRDE